MKYTSNHEADIQETNLRKNVIIEIKIDFKLYKTQLVNR